ncbi:aminoacyl-tRNA deacylase [Candidatus Margulisiibacteriota bacterium]
MPVKKLKYFLDYNKTKYISISHSPAFTAQEIAASAHISGSQFAKTVIVKLDGKMCMAVLPGVKNIDLKQLKSAHNAYEIELATEKEFKNLFPECEIGAMPPFGNLYNLQVYVDESLANEKEILFNAGTHTELISMSYQDFIKLAKPKILKFVA